ERSEICSALHPSPRASLASLKFSAALPVGPVDPPVIETHSGGIKVEINEGEPPWPRWIMILDHGDERLQWIRQKIYAADSGPAFILQLVRHALPPCPGNVNFCTVAPVQIAGICWLITSSLACCIVGCQEDQTMRGVELHRLLVGARDLDTAARWTDACYWKRAVAAYRSLHCWTPPKGPVCPQQLLQSMPQNKSPIMEIIPVHCCCMVVQSDHRKGMKGYFLIAGGRRHCLALRLPFLSPQDRPCASEDCSRDPLH
ncbi:hypothetical protein KUCAC02_002421, partial [Chaenocephalus aceratus]